MEFNIDNKHVFLFQGLGIDPKTILHLLNEKQMGLLGNYCDKVENEIGLNLWDYAFENEGTLEYEEFNSTMLTYVMDNVMYKTFVEYGIVPSALLGYSMGYVTALACGGAITFETGVQILRSVYEYQASSLTVSQAMGVIIGIHCDDVEKLIIQNKLDEFVDIASENNDNCIVVSGQEEAVDKLMKIAEESGALKAKRVHTRYAFHSRYAEIGIEEYIKCIDGAHVVDSPVPIVSCLSKKIVQSSADLKDELIKNVTHRMYWKQTIEFIESLGMNSYVEVNFTDSLTKFTKMINMDNSFLTYKKFLSMKMHEDGKNRGFVEKGMELVG